MTAQTPEPRLGIFREGDTVGEARRDELLALPGADAWEFDPVGIHSGLEVRGANGERRYTLRHVGRRS